MDGPGIRTKTGAPSIVTRKLALVRPAAIGSTVKVRPAHSGTAAITSSTVG